MVDARSTPGLGRLSRSSASDSLGAMPQNRAAIRLFVLALPVWAFGLYHSQAERERQTAPRAARQWHARYAKLEPHLAGVRRVALVPDPNERGKGPMRLFRAQYVLAPTVIRPWPQLPAVRHRRLSFIYDFENPRALHEALAAAAAQAERSGVELKSTKVARGLFLVTMKKE